MTITISNEVEAMLREKAAQAGKTPDQLAEETLRQALLDETPDDWDHRVRTLPVQTGVSLTDEQLSRENLYED